MYKHKQPLRLS